MLIIIVAQTRIILIIVLVHWTRDGLQLVLHLLGGGSLFLINKVSGAIFAHCLIILIKSIVHDWMVIRTGERSFVNYFWRHAPTGDCIPGIGKASKGMQKASDLTLLL